MTEVFFFKILHLKMLNPLIRAFLLQEYSTHYIKIYKDKFPFYHAKLMHKFALNAGKYPNGVEVFLGMRLPNLNLYVLVTTMYPFGGLLKTILDNYINIPK